MSLRRLWILVSLLLALPALGQEPVASEARTAPWSREVVDLFAGLPVQDGGRVKPMEKLAGIHLLTLNGKRSLELPSGEKVGPTEWLLDCLFHPDQARTYEHFRVQNDAVLTAIGLERDAAKKKSDRYSYEQLRPALARLEQEVSRVARIDGKARTPTQKQILKLSSDLFRFEGLTGFLEPVRWRYRTGGSPALEELYDGRETSSLSEVLGQGERLFALAREVRETGGADRDALQALFGQLDSVLAAGSQGIAYAPPTDDAENPDEWWTLSGVVQASFFAEPRPEAHIETLARLERLEAAKGDPAAFTEELRGLSALLVGMAEARGEYEKIPLEISLYRWKLFPYSQVLFLLGFLLLVGSWLRPSSRWLVGGVWGANAVALALLTAGIVLRCIIRERPPVVSLYDTILFITATGTLVALVAEGLVRMRIALAVATLLGVGGMFLAGRYEIVETRTAGDTMASVVAVLDTNYYLAIHVTTITLGYAGGLVAALFAHFWIFGRLFGVRRGDRDLYRMISRLTYGAVCFSLLFSIFGTIMGGVWANDSWGRFWGWDPKENGALLICLWELIILHSRLGGFIRERGLAILSVLLGVVVSASWWGVNLLSVGLHSYGFTEGVGLALVVYWTIAGLVTLLAWFEGVISARATPQA
jgi:ABC-type transport system involved in cytochrome c biogenesis permease subunit